MSRPIDEKIVRMTLENDRFKKDLADTLRSFQQINEATENTEGMDLSSMADGVGQINSKFSALGVVAASVLKRITDGAINTGKRLASGLIDPLVEGGKTRALNLEQARFQFEGLGMDVDETMKSALDAVKGTAYGLDEAALVAGQFGASGMEAGDDMTKSLLGISGVAAMTGSSYEDVGNVFTKVAGNGRLMGDDLLRLSARGVNAAATIADEMGLTEEAVREMVTAGEVDFQMFSDAMSNAFGEHATRANETYTGSLANLKAALGRIGAEVSGPKLVYMRDLFNTTTDKVDELAGALEPLIDAFNKMRRTAIERLGESIKNLDFSKFAELGGMTSIVDTFWNVVSFGQKILGSISEGFKRVFPGSFMTAIVSLTDWFQKLTANLQITDSTVEKITVVFQGVFAVMQTVWTVVKELAGAFLRLIPEGTGGKILDLAVYLAEMAIAMNDSVQEGNFLTDAISGIGFIFSEIGEILSIVIEGLLRFAGAVADEVGPAIDWLIDLLGPLGDLLNEVFGEGGFSMENIMGAGVLTGAFLAFEQIRSFVFEILHIVKGLTIDIAANIRRLGSALGEFIMSVKYKNLLTIALALGVLATALKLLESISWPDMIKGIIALAGSMTILSVGMTVMDGLDFSKGMRIAASMVLLAAAVSIMASALKKISDLKPQELTRGLVGLAGVMAVLTIGVKGLTKNPGKMKTGAIQLVALAVAIRIMASAVDKLASIDTKGLVKGVSSIGIILLELGIFLKIADRTKFSAASAVSITIIAGALHILIAAIEKITEIDTAELWKAIGAMTALLAVVATVGTLGSVSIAGAAGLVVMAAAMKMLMGPITDLSEMSWEELAKGILGVSVALAAVAAIGSVGAISLLGAAGIAVMAGAMILLMAPIKMFSEMSWGSIIKGITGMALALGVLGAAGTVLGILSPLMLAAGIALTAMGVGMTLVAGSIMLFATALVTLAGLTATSIAAIVSSMGMLIRGMTGLVTDIADFVVELASAIIQGFARIIPELVEAVHEVATKILIAFHDNLDTYIEVGVGILNKLMDGMDKHLVPLVEKARELIIKLMDAMSDSLEENGDEMVASLMRLLGEALIMIINTLGEILKGFASMLPFGIGDKLVEDIDGMMDTAEDGIREGFNGEDIANEHAGDYGGALGRNQEYIKGEGEGLSTSGADGAHLPDWALPGNEKGEQLAGGVRSKLDLMRKTGNDISQEGEIGSRQPSWLSAGGDKGGEFDTGIRGLMNTVSNTGTGLSDSGESGSREPSWLDAGSGRAGTFDSGISSMTDTVYNTSQALSNSGNSGAASGDSWYSTGSNAAEGFIQGIRSKEEQASWAANDIMNSATQQLSRAAREKSPSRVTMETGYNFGEGLVIGIKSKAKEVGRAGTELAKEASQGLARAMDIPDVQELRMKLVLDDSEVDWDSINPGTLGVRPDTSETSGMVSQAKRDGISQNEHNQHHHLAALLKEGMDEKPEENTYNYEVNVTAGGNMSRHEVKKLATQIETELKNKNDRGKMARGEAVIF